MGPEPDLIPYGKQSIDDDDIRAVVEALKGDWLTQGPAVERFEAALAEYCGARHAVAVSNGTVALHLACLAIGLKPGDEGITTPITFAASANCMLYCGATPRFADIRQDTWNIDPEQVRKAVGPKTKVLIPVDFAGLPCDLEEIRRIADAHRLVVIDDACHALGAEYQRKKLGGCGLAEMTVFSFHPVKHITTGEGGAVLTDDAVLAKRLRQLRHHGITRDPADLQRNDGPWYHEMQELGYNGRITDFQCALGQSQLGKLDQFLSRRREIAAKYRSALAGVPGLRFQGLSDGRAHAYHLFVVHLDPERYDRRVVFEGLRARGVAPQVHYIPVHGQPIMRRLAGVQGPFPHAERYYAGCLSLPMYPGLTDAEQESVVSALKDSL